MLYVMKAWWHNLSAADYIAREENLLSVASHQKLEAGKVEISKPSLPFVGCDNIQEWLQFKYPAS